MKTVEMLTIRNKPQNSHQLIINNGKLVTTTARRGKIRNTLLTICWTSFSSLSRGLGQPWLDCSSERRKKYNFPRQRIACTCCINFLCLLAVAIIWYLDTWIINLNHECAATSSNNWINRTTLKTSWYEYMMATSAMSNDESYYGISYLTTSTITKMIIFLFSFYSKLEISREFFYH